MLLWQLKLKILILIGAKHLRIIIDKVDVFIRPYDGTRYLVLLGPEKYDTIYDRIRHFKSKSGISYFASHNYGNIEIDSYDVLPLKNTDFVWCCHTY